MGIGRLRDAHSGLGVLGLGHRDEPLPTSGRSPSAGTQRTPAISLRRDRSVPNVTLTRSRWRPSPQTVRSMGGARLPPCLGARRAGGGGAIGSGAANGLGARGRGAGLSAAPGSPRGHGAREGAGRRRTAQPMGAAGGGAGRGVVPLAAARWTPRLFGPGGGRAEPAAPTLRFSAPAARTPPSSPPDPPP